jgi:hypothetical protein
MIECLIAGLQRTNGKEVVSEYPPINTGRAVIQMSEGEVTTMLTITEKRMRVGFVTITLDQE